ncbi:exostosin [Paramecium bursaria Chlorella virus NE-JV-1]|nr:exostosin [Paramecium bursaria Chlorella virus NE-JV-1]
MKFEDISKIPESEYVTCERIFEHCRSIGLPYLKPDHIKSGYQNLTSNCGWKGDYDIVNLQNAMTIVTGYSDHSIGTQEIDILQRLTLRSWFANNIDLLHPKLVAVPLGLPNEVDFPIYGNTRRLHDIAQEPKMIKNIAYMNFKIETFPSERKQVFDAFSILPWVTTGTIDLTENGHRKYLKEIRDHKFCLCPRGNGVDTHRLWECLYLGTIPICKRSETLRQFEDLPILFVDDWSEVTPEYLDKIYDNFMNRDFDVQKMTMSYWRRRLIPAI